MLTPAPTPGQGGHQQLLLMGEQHVHQPLVVLYQGGHHQPLILPGERHARLPIQPIQVEQSGHKLLLLPGEWHVRLVHVHQHQVKGREV